MWKLKFLCSENVSLTISSLFGRGGMRLIFSALLASVLVAPVAHAQQPNDDENELEEVVVTATRIPTPLADTLPTTAIITAEDIERIKPQDFGELLKLKSGIGFRDSGGRGSVGGLFVRGTSSSQTLILIDGIRTSSATNGQTAIQRIPLESIERIEIIKGPMSGVYGADAIGGVIQIFTKAYQEEGTFANVSTTVGSNRLRKHYAHSGYGDENFSVSASLSKESTIGIDRTTFKGEEDDRGEFKSGGNEDRDGFEQSSGNFSLSLYPQDELVFKISHVQSSATIEYDNTSTFQSKYPCKGDQKRSPIGTVDCEDPPKHIVKKVCFVKAIEGVYRDICTNSVLMGTDDLELNEAQIKNRNLVPDDPTVEYYATDSSSNRIYLGEGWHNRTKLNTTSIQFDYDHAENVKLSGNFGVTEDSLTNNAPRSWTDGNYFRTRKTDYSVQADLILSTKNQVTFGVDYQKDKVDTKNPFDETKRTNKGLFALWQHQRNHSSTVLNARYDRNSSYGSISNYGLQQSFDLNDEYEFIISHGTAFRAPTFNDLYYPFDGFGIGNPDVEPEESKSFEISLRASLDEVNWQINAYQTKVKNLIDWAPSPSGVWRPSNVDNSTLRGIELELDREWDDYIFRTSLDYLDARDDETGEFLVDRARASGSIELGKQIGNFYVGVDTFYEHDRFEKPVSFRPGIFLPGYALWGLSANYNYQDRLLISGRIDNLFDKQYVTHIATSDNSYQNEGRTVQISVEYKF